MKRKMRITGALLALLMVLLAGGATANGLPPAIMSLTSEESPAASASASAPVQASATATDGQTAAPKATPNASQGSGIVPEANAILQQAPASAAVQRFAAPQAAPATTYSAAEDLARQIGTYQTAVIALSNTGLSQITMYEGEDAYGKTVGAFASGTVVKVYDRGTGWSLASVGARYGYLQTRYLDFGSGTSPWQPDPVTGDVYKYIVPDTLLGYVNLYPDASAASNPLDRLLADTYVRVHDETGGWAYIEVGGQVGYVQSRNLSYQRGGTGAGAGGSIYASIYLPSPSSSAYLFSEANANSAMLTMLTHGTRVRVLREGPDWTNVEMGNLTGYVKTAFLQREYSQGQAGTYMTVRAQIAGGHVPLYLTASTSGTILSSYPAGTSVKLISQAGDWSQVEVGNYVGYMLTSALQAAPGQGTSYTYATVRTQGDSKLNLRQSASATSASLGRYPNGTQVWVVEYGPTWSRVEVGGKTGYMMNSYLSIGGVGNPGGTPGTPSYTSATVKNKSASSKLNLREGSNTSSRSLGLYPNGTAVRVLEYGAAWCRVEVSGKTGYMATSNLSFGGTSYTPTYTYATTTATVSMHQQASLQAERLLILPKGTAVTVLQYGVEWTKVSSSGLQGYIQTPLLSMQ